MTMAPATTKFERAVLSHLSSIQGLRGVQGFVGVGGEWTEVVRLGEIVADSHAKVLAAFDAQAGGAVEAVSGPNGGWLATYMLGGPGLDLTLIMHLKPQKPQELQAKLKSIEASVGWLMVAALEDRRHVQDERAFVGEIGVQILLDAARARSRRVLADQWIARLEKALQPGLVAVHWMRGDKPRLTSVSGGGTIERQSDARGVLEQLAKLVVSSRAPKLIQPIAKASGPLTAPDTDPASEFGATDEMMLVERVGGGSAMVVPVFRGAIIDAVIVVVFDPNTDSSHLLRPAPVDDLSGLLTEALAIQRRGHPSVFRRIGNWISGLFRAVFGTTFWKLKLAVVVMAAAIAIAAVTPSQQRPDFTASIEARERRVISAPFDGFLAEAPFQIGDSVVPGDVLVALEQADIRLEIAQQRAELAEIEAELQAARAERDVAATRLLGSRIAQSQVTLDLLARQLDLARFEAQSAAVVVGGDAWRRVGDRVRLGEPLLEVAAADSFRVRAFVDEDWVANLPPRAEATLLLTAYPGSPMTLQIDVIGADPVTIEGSNSFPVWLTFAEPPAVQVLDGMRGVVRVDVGERTFLEAYSRGLVRWVQRALWRWG